MKQALGAFEMAKRTEIKIDDLELTEEQRKTAKKYCVNGTLSLFSLPGGNICVPSMLDDGEETIPYIHVMNDKVSL